MASPLERFRAVDSGATASPASRPSTPGDGTWQELPAPTRTGHTAVVDAKRNRIVLVSGFGWTAVAEVWERGLDPQSEWKVLAVEGTGPSPRIFATAVHDPGKERVFLFGGYDGNTLFDEVWELRLNGRPRWSRVTPVGTAPSPRYMHSAIYDTNHDRMIVFGGTDRRVARNDVWTLDLKGRPRWEALAPPGDGPSPRRKACALHDAARGRMLVVGGETSSLEDSTQSVWELDLTGAPTWRWLSSAPSDLVPNGIGPGVLDAAKDRALFHDGTGLDVLTLTLSAPMRWTRIRPEGSGPRPRADHVAVLDPSGRRMWIHGGASGVTPRFDTWSFPIDGTPAWSRVPADGEAERRTAHTAVFDSRRGRMVIFGGRPSWDGPGTPARPEHKVWVQDFARGDAWEPLEPAGLAPTHRSFHTAVYDSLRDRMIIFGGYDGSQTLNEVWALAFGDSPTWTRIQTQGDVPSPRTSSAAIFDPIGDRMIVFGGGGVLNDVWVLQFDGSPAWHEIRPTGVLPPGNREHSAVLDPAGQRMIVFGGITTATGYDNDVWTLTLSGPAKWQQVFATGGEPLPRQSAVAVYDTPRSRMIVHGGYDGSNRIRDVWELSFAGVPAWRELSPEGSVPVFWFDHSAVLDPTRDRMVIFGDFGTWALNLGPDGPGRRAPGSFLHEELATVVASERRLLVEPVRAAGTTRGRWDVRAQFAEAGDAKLEVRSVTGRLLVARAIPDAAAGSLVIPLPESATFRSGIYFLRLRQGDALATTKVVHLR